MTRPLSRPCRFSLLVLLTALLGGSQTASADENPRLTPIVRAIKQVKPGVVNILSKKTSTRTITRGGLFPTTKPERVNGFGTGVIIDPRGYIVTNHHVVKEVDALRVKLADGSSFLAQIVAKDAASDLAVIKIDSKQPLPIVPIGTSSDLLLGETVLAIGNPFGYEHTVTKGIVSHLSRDVEVNDTLKYSNLIQTDAAINPGNSGGPLVNLAGEVIGINVAIRAGAQRIGFAIPIDQARRVVARMLNIEVLDGAIHGLATRDVKNAETRKLVVESALANSPGNKAGFKRGDVISKVENQKVYDRVDFERALLHRTNTKPVTVTIIRDGNTKNIELSVRKMTRQELVARRAQPSVVIRGNNAPIARASIARTDKTWTVLGMSLRPHALSPTQTTGNRYRGGMLVTQVRPGSPAQKNGISVGDVLVGLHVWETVTAENVSYVLDHPKLANFSPVKFYILRGSETLFGHLKVQK